MTLRNTKRIKPTKEKQVPIALNSPVVFEGELPLKFVHYPEIYGIFFGFSECENSEVFLCSCNKDLVENYLLYREETSYTYDNQLDNAIFSRKHFPSKISNQSLSKNFSINFKDKICHRCNLKTPTLRYCHEMYGGKFKQHYGWYINQIQLRFAYLKFYSESEHLLPANIQIFANNIKELRIKRESLVSPVFDRNKFIKINEISNEISKLQRNIDNFFENIAREEFGFRKIGEGNVSELIMTKIIEQIYDGKEIIRHYRPKWLEGLELDVFVPELNLGFEYQGQQHFFAIKAWGGKIALKKVQERDNKKRIICKSQNVNLIEIDYTEPLEIDYIKEKIKKHCG